MNEVERTLIRERENGDEANRVQARLSKMHIQQRPRKLNRKRQFKTVFKCSDSFPIHQLETQTRTIAYVYLLFPLKLHFSTTLKIFPHAGILS